MSQILDRKLVLLAATIVLSVLGLQWMAAGPAFLSSLDLSPALDGPDLTVRRIVLTPAVPDVGQEVNIRVEILNQGNANAAGFYAYLYVDPADRPPEPGTPDTSYFYLFGLNAGASTPWTVTGYTFDTPGCDHVVYAWVDRDDDVIEADETNNLVALQVCVGTTPTPTASPTATQTPTPTPTLTATPTATPEPCVADFFEPDDSCGAARSIATDGTHQQHTLCPVEDQDWVRFTAQVGITYTLATANVGPDGDTVLSLYNQCDQPPASVSDPAFGTGVQVVWQAQESGDYYLKVNHHETDYGPDAGYELYISASSACQGDVFELDNGCTTARDLAIGGDAQRHQFCHANDQDWTRFTAVSGATYTISTTSVGPDANPILYLYDQCAFGAPTTQGQQIEWTAPAAGVFYLAIQNHDPNTYGPTTQYDLSIALSQCAPDDYEEDDSVATASLALPTGDEQLHDFCPLGDEDWARFQATAGQLYVLETYDLGSDSDTILCVYDTDGATELVCDDDGGGGLASRLRWTAPAAGYYYAQVSNHETGVSGPTTTYRLAIHSGEPLDNWEPDNGRSTAQSIATDGTLWRHNIAPEGDQDWVQFEAVAGEPYVMQAACLGGDCDTVMHLLGSDGSTELARNDDYGAGTGSRIAYVFATPGTYYVRVHHYRSNRAGSGTRYDLSVTRGAQPPTPTPTLTPPPTPGPTPSPPPSGVQTLIVTNRERLEALYGTTAAANIMDYLSLLASAPPVKGVIIQAEADSAALTAYTLWQNELTSTTRANDVAGAVRNLVLAYLDNNPNVQYIVLVGNDLVVPFRRVPDRTRHPESRYQAQVSGNTPIWAACRDDMTLTDDYYADRVPSLVNGREVYVPDYAIGRLPEGADEIVSFISTFLAGGQVTVQNALVTGWDFVVDTGEAISDRLAADLGPTGTVDDTLMGDWWTASALRDLQLNASPRFDLQSINGHASHHLQQAPLGGSVADSDVESYGSADLARSLIFTVGCHSGLNDVRGLPAGLDLAQAIFGRGANYVGNTGYGWGSGTTLGWSERLMYGFAQSLTAGTSVPIGQALKSTKQTYFSESADFDAYDEKAMMEVTLYGLPHYQLVSGGILGTEDPFPSVTITSSLPLGTGDVRVGPLSFGLVGSFDALDEHQVTDGTYFAINQGTEVVAGQPVQPQFYADVTALPSGRVHGVLLRSAHFTDTAVLDPLIAQPVNEWVEDWAEPAFDADGWWPPQLAGIQNISAPDSEADVLVTRLGQYSGQLQQARLYDGMDLDLLYSDSADWTGPEISYVGEQVDRDRDVAVVKVEAWDLFGVLGGVVSYTGGNQQWLSVDLAYDAGLAKWVAEIPASPPPLYYVQIVDNGGNVSVSSNKGRYFRIPEPLKRLFLPMVTRSGS